MWSLDSVRHYLARKEKERNETKHAMLVLVRLLAPRQCWQTWRAVLREVG